MGRALSADVRHVPSTSGGLAAPRGRDGGSMTGMSISQGYAQLLELLERHADPVEFERPVVEARAEGLARDDIAALDEAKRSALHIRAKLEAHERREAELSALFQTASDLAALSGVDDVLAAIVRRARMLLRREVAYLCLNDDEAGDTYMRVTDGSVSADFQQLRLPLGAGLGGKVAQQGVPVTSTQYLTDDRVAHTSDIDTAVIEEGLISIMGVPLKLGDTVIGVLFAADRTERAFSRDDVALLSSFAAHAAVALDNARLLAETREALASLEQANAALQQQGRDTELAVRAHDRLAELILRGGGVSDVAAELSELLEGSVTVNIPAPAERTAGPGVTSVPVPAAADVAGELVLTRDGEPRAADLRVLERGALVTALLLLFRRQVADAAHRGRRDFLEDLLLGAPMDAVDIADRAADLDVPTDAVMVVAVCSPERHRGGGEQAAAFLAAKRHGLSARIDGYVVLLLPGDDAGAVARDISVALGRSLSGPVTVGAQLAGTVGDAATHGDEEAGPGAVSLTAAHDLARRCLSAMLALGKTGDGATMSDLGFVGVVLSDGASGESFVADTLGALLGYDAERGTDLVATLDAYFRCGEHLRETATALHVHPNTVSQRLSRVATLLGDDWSSPSRALQVQLALQLRAVLGHGEHKRA